MIDAPMRHVKRLCETAKAASRQMALIDSGSEKNRMLGSMGKALLTNASYIIRENAKDLRLARQRNLSKVLIDRLSLDRVRIKAMAESLYKIAGLKDPVGEVIETIRRPNGLLIKR